MKYQLYIKGKSVDLFSDESLQLTRQLKDFKDITKLKSDYTQGFKIPASDRNNSILSHWWNIDLVSGFDANKKVNAHIEIDNMVVFTGVIEVVDVLFKNMSPSSYSVTFYGDVKKATTAMGVDTLQDLNTDAFNHTRNVSNITSSWSGSLLSGKILYPVIAWKKPFAYGYDHADNIRIDTGTGVEITDLKPSILLKELLKLCFTHYGYTTQGGFFSNTYFDDLYVATSAYAGTLNETTVTANFTAEKDTRNIFSNEVSITQYTSESLDPTNSFNVQNGIYTAPTSGTYSFRATFDIGALGSNTLTARIYKNNVQDDFVSYTQGGTQTINHSMTLNTGDQVDLRMISSNTTIVVTNIEFRTIAAPNSSSNQSINMSELFPQMKVVDFLSQISQTFNLVFIPISDTRIDIESYQDWLATGAIVDYSKYVDIETITHKKQPVPNSLNYKHKEGEDFVNIAYRNNAGRSFGSVSSQLAVDFGTGELKVESPFTIVPPAILNKQNSSGSVTGSSDIQLVTMIDNENTPVFAELLLFYYNGLKSVSDSWRFESTTKTTFPVIAPFSAYPTTGTTNSVAFSLESSLDGNAPQNTLLEKFWLDYISRIYSPSSRIIEIKAYLPVGEWISMSMNSSILIHGRYFKVEKISYDLTKNIAKISLFTYPVVTTWSASSTGNNWVVTPTQPSGTYIGTGSQGNTLGNVTPISGTTSTSSPNPASILDEFDEGNATP